jgi:hypothetical protein
MGLGGVDKDAEFDESNKMIRRWLFSFEDDDSPAHRHNASVLDTFLTSKIMRVMKVSSGKREFHLRKRDLRLIITNEECYAIFRNAEQSDALRASEAQQQPRN